MTPLWIHDPTILFRKNNILELWPMDTFTYHNKINAIVRVIIILSLIGVFITQKYSIIVISFLALLIIAYLSNRNTFNKMKKKDNETEGFSQINTLSKPKYHPSTTNNPLSNVLLTDIVDNPERPSGEPVSYETTTSNIETQRQKHNKHISGKNYDLWERLDNDNSNRAFYTTANSKIVNDQDDFLNYLYGDMKSSKAGGKEGEEMMLLNNERYIQR